MPEAERARSVRVALDELPEPLPRVRRRRDVLVALEHVVDQRAREGDAEHRGPAQQRAVARLEPVDPRSNQGLDRLGQLLRLGGGLVRQRELAQEERVAAAALRDRLELLVAEPPLAGRRLGKRLRVLGGERLEPQGECRQRRVALCRDEPVRAGPASGAGQPGIVVELGPQVAEQLGGRVVHPVDVLEEQQRRAVEQPAEELRDDAVQSRPPERAVERVDLRRRLHLDVERRSQQRRPRDELLVHLGEPVGEEFPVVGPAAVELDAEQLDEQRLERVVRSRGLVLLARRGQLQHVAALLEEVVREPRLADPGLADELDQRPEARAHRRHRGRKHGALPLAADERELLLRGGRHLGLDPTDGVNVERGHRLGDAFERERLERRSSRTRCARARACPESSAAARASPCPSAVRRARPSSRGWCTCGGTRPRPRPRRRGRGSTPMPQRERRLEVGDAARGAEDALLVLALGLGRPGDEDDLAAVAVDVGLEERHAVLVGHLLRRVTSAWSVSASSSGPLVSSISSTPPKWTNATAAWRCSGSARPDSTWRRTRSRDAGREVEALGRRQQLDPASRPRAAPSAGARPPSRRRGSAPAASPRSPR